MKKSQLLILSVLCFFTTSIFAQKKVASISKVPQIKFCNAASDTAKANKMSLAALQEWVNGAKVNVKCSDGKNYQLHQFGIQVIVKNPMEVKDFGLGLDGFPIMAKRTIAKLQPGDTVYLKDVIGYDDKQSEIKLPGIAIAVTE